MWRVGYFLWRFVPFVTHWSGWGGIVLSHEKTGLYSRFL